ncbi:MAG: MBL fold metallo-hydrolase [Candidatus Berkelbacteria bacterium]
MQIKFLGGEKFEIKTKSATIDLGYTVSIDKFVLPGPGEYEKSGVIVHGIQDESNAIYVIRAEELNICYLGKIGHLLKEDEIKEIGNIDILFLPLGEDGSVKIKEALTMLSKIDPFCVIPMLYTDIAEFTAAEKATSVDLLKIKKSDLPVEGRVAYVLES